eukprot:gene20713-14939_t
MTGSISENVGNRATVAAIIIAMAAVLWFLVFQLVLKEFNFNSSGSSKVLKKTTRLARGAVELYRGAKHRRFAMLGITGGSDWCWTQTGVGAATQLKTYQTGRS